MATSIAARVQKRRSALRASGLRPVQIWVPDTRRPGFAAQCLRQSALAAQADAADPSLAGFLDAALLDIGADGDADADADADIDLEASPHASPHAAPA